MLASFFQPHIATANLLFIGLIQGLIVSMLAMGIVLIYRSTASSTSRSPTSAFPPRRCSR